jgi:GH35 family endo-1,4-beta-xylanase
MRGHNILWAKKKYAMPWMQTLSDAGLRAAVDRRIEGIVGRYRGRVVSWDVDNEMLDGSYFRDRLGEQIVPYVFEETHRLDPKPLLFVNEYGIIGSAEKTERMIALIKKLQAEGAPVSGIGIQAHDTARFVAQAHDLGPMDRPEIALNTPLTPEIFLHTMDRLYQATGLPIHITEISAKTPNAADRGEALATLFRLGFSHPGVQALVLWGFGAKTHWMGPQAALMDADNTVNAAGKRVGGLLSVEWTTRGTTTTDNSGAAAWRGFYGVYTVEVALPDGQTFTREVSLTAAGKSAAVHLPPGA